MLRMIDVHEFTFHPSFCVLPFTILPAPHLPVQVQGAACTRLVVGRIQAQTNGDWRSGRHLRGSGQHSAGQCPGYGRQVAWLHWHAGRGKGVSAHLQCRRQVPIDIEIHQRRVGVYVDEGAAAGQALAVGAAHIGSNHVALDLPLLLLGSAARPQAHLFAPVMTSVETQ